MVTIQLVAIIQVLDVGGSHHGLRLELVDVGQLDVVHRHGLPWRLRQQHVGAAHHAGHEHRRVGVEWRAVHVH